MSPKPKYKPEIGNEAPVEGEVVILKLKVPAELYESYEKQAEKQGLKPEELVVHRLQRCKDHAGIRTLFFSDSQRQQLENILQKRPLENAEQTLALINAGLSVRVGDLPPITLTAQQVKRIGMMGYAGQTAEERFQFMLQSAISKLVGI